MQRLVVPEPAAAVGREPEQPGPRLALGVALGHEQVAGAVERHRVRVAKALGEALEAIAGELEHRAVLDVADEQLAVRVERQPEAEAAGRGDLLERAGAGVDAVDLPGLASAPDAAVARDRHPFRVVEPVDEHPHTATRVDPGTAAGVTSGSAQSVFGIRAYQPGRPGSRS